jgi:aquaporin Z
MRVPLSLYAAELAGTALLVLVGLSFVILFFGADSPMLDLLPDPGLRRALTGLLFGSTGALIAISPLGKTSGAHINPVVTLAFWAKGTMGWDHALGYVLAQLAGAVVGALPLLLWGPIGGSVSFGATTPGTGYGAGAALLGEVVTTLALVVLLFAVLGHERTRPFTPLLFPLLYALMVFLEAPVSGTSTNPARSLGPAVVGGVWEAWWVYWVGPTVGALLGVAIHRWPLLRLFRVEVAKVYHFEHDPHHVFRRIKEEIEP